MSMRKIVHIDEEKCNGCGLCITNCAEGALQIIDGKAKLVKDIYCDGLGACLGHCPLDAISVIEREAENFDEEATHKHLQSSAQINLQSVHSGCPGSRMMQFSKNSSVKIQGGKKSEGKKATAQSELLQWPVQLKLVPFNAPYFNEADLLVTADCVPFAYSSYHNDFLKGKALVVGCPKLDDITLYREKLESIIKFNNLKSITVLRMEVPCCSGIATAVISARDKAGVNLPVEVVTIGIQGNIVSQDYL